jgi:hypothetical protein
VGDELSNYEIKFKYIEYDEDPDIIFTTGYFMPVNDNINIIFF